MKANHLEPKNDRDKAAADLVLKLVTCGHRVLVLCHGCDTSPYPRAPNPCEEKKTRGGVWALRVGEANQTLESRWIKNMEVDRIVLDLNRDLIVLQAGSFYDPPNVDYERIETRVLKHYWDEAKARTERTQKEAAEGALAVVTAEQQHEFITGGRMSKSARMPVQRGKGPGEVKRNHASIMTSIMGAGTETGRLTSEKSNMCYDRKCDSCGRECAAVPADLVHFNCGPCRFEERNLTMRVLSQVKEAGAAVVKKTGLAFHDIQKAVAEVAKRPHALAPDGNVIACDPPFKYKSQGAHAHSPPSDGFGGFLPPGDHRHRTFAAEKTVLSDYCLYDVKGCINAHECQCNKCTSGRKTIDHEHRSGYVYVDREKYEAGKAACFNKALAPGMNHCKIGDAVRLRNGKCVGRIKEIQYTAPLQAVVELISGEPETYQLHNLELVSACAEIEAGADHVCVFTHRRASPGEVRVACRRCGEEAACKVCGRLTSRDGIRSLFWEKDGIVCASHRTHVESKPAGEMGETEPEECKLGKVEDDEMAARDAEESNRPALSSEKRKELYDVGKGIEFEYMTPGGAKIEYEPTTRIVVQFNLPQEPPCTCENVNLPHTPNCPWKKWKNQKK